MQTAQKTKEGSQIRCLEQVVHVHVEIQRRVPMFQKVRKVDEIPHVPFFRSVNDFSVCGEKENGRDVKEKLRLWFPEFSRRIKTTNSP